MVSSPFFNVPLPARDNVQRALSYIRVQERHEALHHQIRRQELNKQIRLYKISSPHTYVRVNIGVIVRRAVPLGMGFAFDNTRSVRPVSLVRE
jgi:hypothetical protein